eukprot:TRINITY_DN65587_c0_g1_i1.p1 TRINITY_DN65587_c0_g1~~TRINITY_DN65587_c0_g1_i1.p1  ORF type:complete len:342 (+),score=108.60 TRINITY_DN65587_c0_g1_i1:87-1112(+)
MPSPQPQQGESCLPGVLIALKLLAVIGVIMCAAANIMAMDDAVQNTWFVPCEDCRQYGGDRDCKKCCANNCTIKKEAFFYILRLYSLAFCILSCFSMLPSKMGCLTFRWTWMYFRILKSFLGRGLLHIFIGFMTVESNPLSDDSSSEKYTEVVGYIVMALGGVHLVLACLCFADEPPDWDEQEGDEVGMTAVGRTDSSPAGHSPPGDSAQLRRKETALERQEREQREADEAMARDRQRMENAYEYGGGFDAAKDRADKEAAELQKRYYATPAPPKEQPPLPEQAAAGGPGPSSAAASAAPALTPIVPPAAAGPPMGDVDADIAKRRAQDDAALEAAYYSGR